MVEINGRSGRIGGIGPKPIDRLGRERDQPALRKGAGGLADGGLAGRQNR